MIKTFDYQKLLPEIEKEVMEALSRVLHSNRLILGSETEGFEREFAQYMGVKHCIAVTSGTTALHLALLSLGVGPGDEVITVSNTCVPTVAAIRLTGALPVFIDIREDDLMMDTRQITSKITAKTRCILLVHLWGKSVALHEVLKIAEAHSLEVIEDCAQACGTLYQGLKVGTFGQMGCFSFYPTKNLGAYGDAGAIITHNDELAERLRKMRMYGYNSAGNAQMEGMNARISEMQAAILRIKLRVFPTWLNRRLEIAEFYNKTIQNLSIVKPQCLVACRPSYHQYVVCCKERTKFIEWLKNHDIGYGIHYPTPVHLMPAYEYLGIASHELPNTVRACSEILSLPIHEGISSKEVDYIVATINQFPTLLYS
jgi:dTDP-4-amino-4,6-dideoxygalactose transaminase